MNARGFFGLLVLLGALEIILALGAERSALQWKTLEAELTAMSIQEAGFRRAEAEIFVDKAMAKAIAPVPLEKLESETIKARANTAVLEAFRKLGLEPELCTKHGTRERLTFAGLSEVSKVSVIIIHNTAVVEYVLTGGEKKNRYPCAEIRAGDFSAEFRVPAGYTARHAGPAI